MTSDPRPETRDSRPATRGVPGFTLVEMLVVLSIIMIIAGVVSVNVVRHQAEARVKGAKLQIQQLRDAVRQYQIEQGRLPTMEQGLEALIRKPSVPPLPQAYPDGGYLDSRRVPEDPWGMDYVYVTTPDGKSFEIFSGGPDRESGSPEYDRDNISSEEP